jgi:cytochrome c biogenesis protein CcmG, thiol:disulfide interchange protein DsbE
MAEPDSALDMHPAHAASGREPSGAPRRLRFLYLLPLLVFAGLALLFLVRLFAGDPSRVPSALIGRPVPAFTLDPVPGLTEAGNPVPGLSDADLKGRVTVVNVWASWCVPCRQEHPALVELAKDPAVRVVGINYKDNPDNARRFLRDLGNPFAAIGADSSGRAAIDWGVYGVPETFVVGPDGTIRHKHIGPLQPGQMRAFTDAVRAAGS